MQKRTNQGGSVLTFVIVGIALAALVGGGIYLVNQRNKQGSSTNQPATNQPVQPPSGSTSSPSPQSTGASTSPSTGSTQSQTPATGVQGSRLPATGPTDTGLQLLAVALLIGVTASYIQSQVHRKRQAALL